MNNMHLVNTKFGQLALVLTDANHAYATTNPEGGRHMLPWTIRNKVFNFVTAHLHLWTDGRFHVGEEKHQNEWERMRNSLYFTEGTPHAKKLAVAELEVVVNDFRRARPDAFAAAEVDSLTSRINALRDKREQLSEETRQVAADIGELIEQRNVVQTLYANS